MVRLRGIEPPHAVPETTALSTELQAQIYHIIIAQQEGICKAFLLFLSINCFYATIKVL